MLAAAVGLVGVTFGVLADAAGFDLPRVVFLSAVVFTGASQFAVVGVVAGGGATPAALGSALLLAARNALYGPVVARFVAPGPRRWLAAHFVIDETTGVAAARDDAVDAADAFWFTGVWLWVLWNAGSVLGALGGRMLGDPTVWGLDAAFPAGFLALLAPHLGSVRGRMTAITAAVIVVATFGLVPAGTPLLLAAAGVVPVLAAGRVLARCPRRARRRGRR